MAATLPIFPLNTVLFPGGTLPLRIFEQRYLEMTKTCLRDGSPFGVCRIREGSEVGAPATHEPVGCTAKIVDWEMPHQGMFHLVVRGDSVFRVVESSAGPHGLIRARIEPLPETPGTDAARALALCAGVLERMLAGADPAHRGNVRLDDARSVSYRLAELLPIELAERQSLLEERTDSARLARLVALLQAG